MERIGEIDRAAVRQTVVDRFTIGKMADAYIGLYQQILSKRP
jgi:hypothetical protein